MKAFLYKLAMAFMPKEYRSYIDLVWRIFQRLDTAEERAFVVNSFLEKQKSDGYISGKELLQWGRDAGLTTKRKGKKAQTPEPLVAHTN